MKKKFSLSALLLLAGCGGIGPHSGGVSEERWTYFPTVQPDPALPTGPAPTNYWQITFGQSRQFHARLSDGTIVDKHIDWGVGWASASPGQPAGLINSDGIFTAPALRGIVKVVVITKPGEISDYKGFTFVEIIPVPLSPALTKPE